MSGSTGPSRDGMSVPEGAFSACELEPGNGLFGDGVDCCAWMVLASARTQKRYSATSAAKLAGFIVASLVNESCHGTPFCRRQWAQTTGSRLIPKSRPIIQGQPPFSAGLKSTRKQMTKIPALPQRMNGE